MKRYDNFGLNIGSNNWLYCEVLAESGTFIRANVINGCWEFVLDRSKREITFVTPFGVRKMPILGSMYQGPWPSNVNREDYNAMIAFMEGRKDAGFIELWIELQKMRAQSFWNRLSTACKAFRASWADHGKYVEDNEDEEDDSDSIPF